MWVYCRPAEVTILTKSHCIIQEGQTLILHILPGELDVLVLHIYVLSESLQVLSFNFAPCIIHISEG